jgi:hypothetical protein
VLMTKCILGEGLQVAWMSVVHHRGVRSEEC